MMGTRKAVAIVGIAILVAAAFLPVTAHDVTLIVSWFAVPVLSLTVRRQERRNPLRLAILPHAILLRAPPARSLSA